MGKSELSKVPVPNWVQSLVKTCFVTGFSLLLGVVSVLVKLVFIGATDQTDVTNIFLISQTVIVFLFINKNLRVENIEWSY